MTGDAADCPLESQPHAEVSIARVDQRSSAVVRCIRSVRPGRTRIGGPGAFGTGVPFLASIIAGASSVPFERRSVALARRSFGSRLCACYGEQLPVAGHTFEVMAPAVGELETGPG